MRPRVGPEEMKRGPCLSEEPERGSRGSPSRRLRIDTCDSTDGRSGVAVTFALSRRDGRALTEEDKRDDQARDRYQGHDDYGDQDPFASSHDLGRRVSACKGALEGIT